MENQELKHYGIPGMKWGVRKARRQLARITKRKQKDISSEEVENFRQDREYYKELGGIPSRIKENGEVQYYDHRNKKVSAEYAHAVIDQIGRDKTVKALINTAGVIAGANIVGSLLYKLSRS